MFKIHLLQEQQKKCIMKTKVSKSAKNIATCVLSLCVFIQFSQAQSIRNNTSVATHQRISTEIATTTPTYEIVKSDINTFKATYTFNNIVKTEVSKNNTTFDFLHIDGFQKMSEVGYPAVPAHNDILLSPSNGNNVISYTYSGYDEYDNFYIHPALEDASDEEGKPEPSFQLNAAAYSKNEFYPNELVSIVDVQTIRGQQIVLVQIRPVQFNPVTHKIRVYRDLTYTVNFEGSKSNFEQFASKNSQKYIESNRSGFLNQNILPKQSIAKSTAIDYLILAPTSFRQAADTLALWKSQLGYNTAIITKESWTSSAIKDSIASRYNSSAVRPDYFVLIGDNEQMPAQIIPYNTSSYPTDLYFACMDGSLDYVPDMAHGRISVTSASMALTVIQKIVNYERNPISDPSFYTNAVTCAYFQDGTNYTSYADGYDDRRFIQTSEEVRNYLMNKGYSITRVYEAFDNRTPLKYNNGYYSNGQSIPSDLLKSNGFAWNGNTAAISSNINDGRFMVLHRDHGYVGGYGWAHPQYVNIYNDINNLSNGNKLPVVFSINCYTGDFSQGECFAENFLRKNNGGAVGVFAHSSESFSGYNDALVLGMIDAIWASPGLIGAFGAGAGTGFTYNQHGNIRTMGDVMNQGLIRMMGTWVSPLRWKLTHELLHYFGDPAMRMWTQNPTTITYSVKDTLARFSNSITVNSNIDNALVTLVINGNLAASAFVLNGVATLNFSYAGTASGIVTISKENCRPIIKNILIRNELAPQKPTQQASAITIVSSHAKSSTTTISWVNGSGDFRLVKMNVSDNFTSPIDGQEYLANSNYLNNGEQIMYVGTENFVSISNLDPYQTYWFRVYEFNNSGVYTLYQTIETTANPANSSGESSTLPVSLLFFKGEIFNQKAQLFWSTADETNNDFFTIEKSFDAIHFETVGIIDGAGNSNSVLNYTFLDNHISSSTLYYRLSQTDWDGKVTTYKPISLKSGTFGEPSISQVESFNGQATFTLNNIKDNSVDVQILDINGRLVSNRQININNGQSTFQLSENLSSGMYVFNIIGQGVAFNQKFTIQ